jgi:hypothetical protein
MDPDCGCESYTLHTMKTRKFLLALLAVSLLLAVLIIVLIFKFYLSNY